MNKILKRLIVFVALVIFLSLAFWYHAIFCSSIDSEDYYILQEECNNKDEEIQKKEEKIRKLKKQVKKDSLSSASITSTSADNILSVIFWEDGYIHYMDNEEFKFYSDPLCTKEITKKLTFKSYVDLEIQNENGYTSFLTLSTEEGPVWSREKPYFKKK